MKTTRLLSALLLAALLAALTGCASFDRLDAKLPEIEAEEITVTVSQPLVGTGRIHAKNLKQEDGYKTADEYHASLDTPAGTVSYQAKGYRRAKKSAKE